MAESLVKAKEDTSPVGTAALRCAIKARLIRLIIGDVKKAEPATRTLFTPIDVSDVSDGKVRRNAEV